MYVVCPATPIALIGYVLAGQQLLQQYRTSKMLPIAFVLPLIRCLQVYVVGERGIQDELAMVGISSLGGPDDNGRQMDGKAITVDPEVRVG